MSMPPEKSKRSPITTHVLDLAKGKAAAQISVTLERRTSGSSPNSPWERIAQAQTGADGRIEDWGPALAPGSKAESGIYRLNFDTEAYFKGSSAAAETFYPSIGVAFRLEHPEQHHHVPLLLSPYGYSTYRGT